jgi:signal transduction histidine kinase
LATGAVLIGMAMTWNRALSREVKLKTDELLASQERLVRSERFAAVGEAAAYVSHEIKNPLMVIGGLARQIGRRLAEDPGCQEKLHIIQNEVRRLENFLGELRDFTRPALPVIKSVDLNRVIQDVQTMMETEARERHIKLHCHLDPYLPVVEADANQMKQVLLNFVKNALEATDSGGEVILRSGSEDQQVWFTVQDTGAGMSPDTLEKIFNPFFTTKDRGSGLGLSVINKIISDHHGTVAVASRPGEGSSFTVKIPSHG